MIPKVTAQSLLALLLVLASTSCSEQVQTGEEKSVGVIITNLNQTTAREPDECTDTYILPLILEAVKLRHPNRVKGFHDRKIFQTERGRYFYSIVFDIEERDTPLYTYTIFCDTSKPAGNPLSVHEGVGMLFRNSTKYVEFEGPCDVRVEAIERESRTTGKVSFSLAARCGDGGNLWKQHDQYLTPNEWARHCLDQDADRATEDR